MISSWFIFSVLVLVEYKGSSLTAGFLYRNKKGIFFFPLCVRARVRTRVCVRMWVWDCSKIRSSVFLSQMRIFTLPFTTTSIPCCYFFIPLFNSLSVSLSLAHSHALVHAHRAAQEKELHDRVWLLWHLRSESTSYMRLYKAMLPIRNAQRSILCAAAWNLITLNSASDKISHRLSCSYYIHGLIIWCVFPFVWIVSSTPCVCVVLFPMCVLSVCGECTDCKFLTVKGKAGILSELTDQELM